MMKLRINPLVAADLKDIRDFIAEDNVEKALATVEEIYGKFENIQLFPGMDRDLSKRVNFRTEYKYVVWNDYVIIYKVGKEFVEIYRVVNRYQDITSGAMCDIILFDLDGTLTESAKEAIHYATTLSTIVSYLQFRKYRATSIDISMKLSI